jgi:hypothetical protein
MPEMDNVYRNLEEADNETFAWMHPNVQCSRLGIQMFYIGISNTRT